ncbi:MAG TPA: AAA family ATPase [Caulobacteraceae bacterium]|jgi:pilus assembly protein CpaE|nr:AAA family ATPase [Caulobacteraceae bacterium]
MNKALSMSDPRFPDDFSLDDDLDFPAADEFVTETPRQTYDPLNPAPQQQPQQLQSPQYQQPTPAPQASAPQASASHAPASAAFQPTPLHPSLSTQPAPAQPAPAHQFGHHHDPLEARFDDPARASQAPTPAQAVPPQQAYVQPAQQAAPHQPYVQPAADAHPVQRQAVEVTPGRPQSQELTAPIQFTQPQQGQGFNPVGEMIAQAEAALGEVNVPRIGIHIFAERTDTADSAQQASRDRRMSRATTVVRLGGIQTALQVYQTEPTPALIIVESGAPANQMIHELDYLAECCDADTKVVVIGAQNDIMLYRELMRRGVSEYLVAPLQPLQLIAAIGQLFNDPSAPFVGRTIAFIGARGGVGASTVAHNTAYALSERMASETVIVDFDLPFGTAGLDFNQDPLTGIADALQQPERLDPVLLDRMLVRCTDKLSLFAAPATLDSDWDVSPEVIEEVANKVRGAAPYVVLDLPHAWNAWVRRMVIGADEVVIVATPDLASLRNAKNMLDLARAARPNDAPPRLVLNQMGVPGKPEIPLKDFANALGIAPTLVLPFDAKLFGHASNNGQMVVEVGAKSKAADGFQYLAQLVAKRDLLALPAPKSEQKQKSSLFSKLFKR